MNGEILSKLALVRDEAWGFVVTRVLVWSTVWQAAVAAVLVGLFLLLAPPLERRLLAACDRLHHVALAAPARAFSRAAGLGLLLLALWFAIVGFSDIHQPNDLLRLVASFALAGLIIRFSSGLVRDRRLARSVAALAWIVAALNILGLVGPTTALLGGMAISIGTLRISVLLLLKGSVLLVVLIWVANTVSRIAEQRFTSLATLSPAMQVLAGKLVRIVSLTLAVVLSLGAVGIDLTAFAVFSGAIGVGIGFGLQKVVSNLISGVILLLDRSIKPGDVIEIAGTYGWITRLNARYVSVATRDGKEYLIPNEDLITERVVNWSYSSNLVRVRVPIGVGYYSDVRRAIALAIEAALAVPRVQRTPKPVCLLMGFGDSTVNLELRFWIDDPRDGTANVSSEVLLEVWDRYHAHDIELPFPQRDLNIRDPEALVRAWTGRDTPPA